MTDKKKGSEEKKGLDPLVDKDGKVSPIDRVITVGSSIPRMKEIDMETLKKVNYLVQDQMTRIVFGVVQNQENILALAEQVGELNKRLNAMETSMLRLSKLQEKSLPFAVKLGLALSQFLNKKDAPKEETKPEEAKA